jgi:hypothetical protein
MQLEKKILLSNRDKSAGDNQRNELEFGSKKDLCELKGERNNEKNRALYSKSHYLSCAKPLGARHRS